MTAPNLAAIQRHDDDRQGAPLAGSSTPVVGVILTVAYADAGASSIQLDSREQAERVVAILRRDWPVTSVQIEDRCA